MDKPRKRRSESLTKDEYRAFKKYFNGFSTQMDCSEDLGIERTTILRIFQLGTGSPENIAIIREKLNMVNANS